MNTNSAVQPEKLFVVPSDPLFKTDRLDLAVLLICRGLHFVGAEDKEGWKHFQFEEKEKCEAVKKEYDYDNPLVKMHDYEAAKRRLNRIVHQ